MAVITETKKYTPIGYDESDFTFVTNIFNNGTIYING